MQDITTHREAGAMSEQERVARIKGVLGRSRQRGESLAAWAQRTGRCGLQYAYGLTDKRCGRVAHHDGPCNGSLEDGR